MQARTATALAVLALQLAPAWATDTACRLSMAPEQWPPYMTVQPGAQPTGLDWELLHAILQEAGCSVQLLAPLPTARRQSEFQQGHIDLLLAASDTAERRRYARFSLPYRYETVAVFSLARHAARYRHLDSLDAIAQQQLPLLVPKVGWYGPAYARLQPTLTTAGHLSTFLEFSQGMRMLQAGRADLIMGDTLAMRHAAQALGLTLARLPFTVLRAPVHLMLNQAKTTPAQLERINGAIQRLEQRGVLAQIRARYGD